MAWSTRSGGRRSPTSSPTRAASASSPAMVGPGSRSGYSSAAMARAASSSGIGCRSRRAAKRARAAGSPSSSAHPGRHVLVVPTLGLHQFEHLRGHLRRGPRAGPSGQILERVCQPSPAGGDLLHPGREPEGPHRRVVQGRLGEEPGVEEPEVPAPGPPLLDALVGEAEAPGPVGLVAGQLVPARNLGREALQPGDAGVAVLGEAASAGTGAGARRPPPRASGPARAGRRSPSTAGR